MRGAAFLLVATFMAMPLAAQDHSGVFVAVNDHGEPVTLVLKQDDAGQIGGSLTAPGVSFQVEGFVEGGGVVGAIYNRQIGIHFYAEVHDGGLSVTLVEVDESGQPDFGRTTELSFARGAQGTPAGAPAASAPGEPAPVASRPEATPPGGSPAVRPVSGDLSGDPSLGYFFRTPSGWGANQQGSLFLLGSDTHHGLILILPHELGTLDALAAEARQGLHDEGVSLRLDGAVQEFGDRGIAADFAGVAQGQPARARAIGLLSPHGGGVTIVALVASASYGPRYDAWVEEIARSMDFRAPETGPIARQWEEEVRGRHLRFMESYYSGGGAGAGGYSLQRSIYLCSNGEYLYRDSSVISADVSGGSASGIGRGGETGRWEVTARGQDGILRLVSAEGHVRQYTLSWRNNLVHLNGERYFRDTNDVCP